MMRFTFAGFALSAVLGVGFVGQAAAQTASCDAAQDMVAMADCVQKQYEAADALLNVAYKAVMADMASIDAGLPKAEQGAAEALKSAQRAWIAVRDGTCAAEGFQWYGGSGRGLAVLSCMLAETQARSAVLAALSQYE